MPVETRRCSVCSTSFSAVIFGGSIFPAQPARREAGAAAALSSTISDNEFQALHSVHRLPLAEFGAAFIADVGGAGFCHRMISSNGNRRGRIAEPGRRCCDRSSPVHPRR